MAKQSGKKGSPPRVLSKGKKSEKPRENPSPLDYLRGVKPLSSRPSAPITPAAAKPEQSNDSYRALVDSTAEQIEVEFMVEQQEQDSRGWRKTSGPGVMQQLRSGKFPVEATLDLHGYLVAEAQVKVRVWIAAQLHSNKRTVCIITGKGKHSNDGMSALRPALIRILTQPPTANQVLAFCNAKDDRGGHGAFLIRLDKPKP